MKHTWIIDEADDAETTISGLRQPERGFFKQEDARLICAAPTLLEACKSALDDYLTLSPEVEAQLNEAIAKAEDVHRGPHK